MHDPNPPTTKKAVQFFVALLILAWATQTLMHQWGYGAEPPAAPAAGPAEARDEAPIPPAQRQAVPGDDAEANAPATLPAEKFVPGSDRFLAGATLELRGEATILSGEVHLRQVCRWSDADRAAFDPIADLVLFRIDAHSPYRGYSLDELKRTLGDAGINLAVVRFAGATSCTVHREDVPYDEHAALRQWITSQQAAAPQATPGASSSAAAQAAAPEPPAHAAPQSGIAGALAVAEIQPRHAYHTLRDLLTTDLSERLKLSPDKLEIHFNPADDKVLNLSEPQFRFNLDPRRANDLGQISYQVEIVTDGGTTKTNIDATVRAWQNQLVVNRPMAAREVIRDSDLLDRRILIDRLVDSNSITREQVIGQAAARELQAGTILTPQMVAPLPLVRMGQLVTVTLAQGGVEVKTVARALDAGSFGQTIRVRNEASRDVYEVICTGPQEVRLPSAMDGGGQGETTASVDRN